MLAVAAAVTPEPADSNIAECGPGILDGRPTYPGDRFPHEPRRLPVWWLPFLRSAIHSDPLLTCCNHSRQSHVASYVLRVWPKIRPLLVARLVPVPVAPLQSATSRDRWHVRAILIAFAFGEGNLISVTAVLSSSTKWRHIVTRPSYIMNVLPQDWANVWPRSMQSFQVHNRRLSRQKQIWGK